MTGMICQKKVQKIENIRIWICLSVSQAYGGLIELFTDIQKSFQQNRIRELRFCFDVKAGSLWRQVQKRFTYGR